MSSTCEQLLPKIEKAQSVTPQTTKYRYGTVISDQWIHWKFEKKSFHSNINLVNICAFFTVIFTSSLRKHFSKFPVTKVGKETWRL